MLGLVIVLFMFCIGMMGIFQTQAWAELQGLMDSKIGLMTTGVVTAGCVLIFLVLFNKSQAVVQLTNAPTIEQLLGPGGGDTGEPGEDGTEGETANLIHHPHAEDVVLIGPRVMYNRLMQRLHGRHQEPSTNTYDSV